MRKPPLRLGLAAALVLLACLESIGIVRAVRNEASLREAAGMTASIKVALVVAAQRREWLYVATAHALAFGLVLLVAVLRLSPREPVDDGSGAALRAYEQAMGLLQAHGQRTSREHDDETRRLRSEMDDKDAMARAGELTSAIVHEVRNGLGTITGYAQIIERSEGSGAVSDAAQQIRDECEALERVVRRFVDFVKRETLHLAPLELERMLARVAGREARARPGIEMVVPAAAAVPVRVVGDEQLLERAFENLIRNALQASTGHVWIDVEEDGDRVLVHVADDGLGIPEDRRGTIRPFETSKGGLGLGLPIALKIVRLHKGDLSLSARTPSGLRATISLPSAGPEPS